MYMKWNDQTFFLITEKPTNKKCLEIFTPINPAGYKILGCLVDVVDNLLEEWYPGLQLNSSKNGSSVQRLSPCFVCQRHYFQLEDIISESYQSESINCENCGSVLIQAVAPDVVFADIDRELVLEECQISFQDTDSKTLGVGAFAYVYQAQVNGINLALKVTAIFDVSFGSMNEVSFIVCFHNSLTKRVLLIYSFIIPYVIIYQSLNQREIKAYPIKINENLPRILKLFQPRVSFYIETSHLFYKAKEITSFYTRLKWIEKELNCYRKI